ncbi:type I secretion C-terminal target domain (VC_A0849 subclass) [Maribacter dokdonensis]|uniref:Type I secretion C-terminal target domain (VC_A0849 subclass) n=1 Tax=Maribacter dokdonensis TaxID=320912 RepID=A0A1H4M9W3_9FLAO|nr:VWD domain-containing protein [Maribacter dokdonensis]SEB79285.1 type I secretion C-terminal target domain (VC_A0849 subclass) [Maribacter dokdonensis]
MTVYNGTNNSETINGDSDDNIIIGALGNDILIGFSGADIYHFSYGDGDDTIIEGHDTLVDKIVFSNNIIQSQITLERVSEFDVKVLIDGGVGGSILLTDQLKSNFNVVETIEFHDGSSINLKAIDYTYTGTSSGDVLYGAAPDVGSSGVDTIYGLDGDDTIYGTAFGGTFSFTAENFLYGGAGNDTIYGDRASDTIEGGEGDDTIDAQHGDDVITGGLGDDTLIGFSGEDTYYFSYGDDDDTIIEGHDSSVDKIIFSSSVIQSQVTFERISDFDVKVLIDGGIGGSILLTDQLKSNFNVVETIEFYDGSSINLKAIDYTYTGTSSSDVLYGAAPDVGSSGVDTIYGLDGDDTIYGTAFGGTFSFTAENFLYGGAGNDTIYGDRASDIIVGGEGDDDIDGGIGDDTAFYNGNYSEYNISFINGQTIVEHINGFEGTDTLTNVEKLSFLDGTVENEVFSVFDPLELDFVLDIPDGIHSGEVGIGTITIINNTGAPTKGAFMIELTSDGALFQATNGIQYSQNELLVLTDDNQNGILENGETATATFNFLNISPPHLDAPIIDVRLQDTTEEINWETIKTDFKPEFISNDAWEKIFSNLSNLTGDTIGSLTDSIAVNNQILTEAGLDTNSYEVGFILELLEAGDFGSIAQRDTDSTLGKGWSFIGDTKLEILQDGSITLNGLPDTEELFNLSSDSSGYYIVSSSLKEAVNIVGERISVDSISPSFIPEITGTYSSYGSDSILTKNLNSYELTASDGSLLKFDSNGKFISITNNDASQITTASYDTSGNLVNLQDNIGGQLNITYNSSNLVSSIIDNSGKLLEFEYNLSNSISKVTELSGDIDFTYENNGLSQVDRFDGENVSYEYDDASRVSVIETFDEIYYFAAEDYVDGVFGSVAVDNQIGEDMRVYGNAASDFANEIADRGALAGKGLGNIVLGGAITILGGNIIRLEAPNPGKRFLGTPASTVSPGSMITYSGATTLLEGFKQLLAAIFGEPHLETFDGLHYDFQGVGEFHLVDSDIFNLQARFEPFRGSEYASATSALSLEIEGLSVGVYASSGNTVLVNGALLELSLGQAISIGRGAIKALDDGTILLLNEYGNGVTIANKGDYLNAVPFIQTEYEGDVVGLLGNANENHLDDITLEDGTVLTQPLSLEELYGVYADSWRIAQEESLFVYDIGQTTESFTNKFFPAGIITLDDFSSIEIAAATQVALDAGLEEDSISFQNALYDILITGDNSFAEAAAQNVNVSDNQNSEIEIVLDGQPYGSLKFSDNGFSSYTSEDAANDQTISNFGFEFKLSGNAWRKADLDYNVTEDTILSFQYRLETEGEIHAIGVDFDDDFNNDNEVLFKLDGTQTSSIVNYDYNNGYSGDDSDYVTYNIRLGEYITGDINHLTFVNDHDAAVGDQNDAKSSFKNVRVYEKSHEYITLDETAFDEYSAGQTDYSNHELDVSRDGLSVTLEGNTWQAAHYDYTVTKNTVIEFNFSSTSEGEIHALGVDNDKFFSGGEEHFFTIGSSKSTIFNNEFRGYEVGDGTVKYTIRLGDYYDGHINYLTFINDHDTLLAEDNGTYGNSTYSNLRLFEVNHDYLLFSETNFREYASGLSEDQQKIISDDALTVTFDTDTWQHMLHDYTVTADTILEFDFRSTSEGGIHAIGVDTDVYFGAGDLQFFLSGTSNSTLFNRDLEEYDGAGADVHYVVRLGDYVTGEIDFITFINSSNGSDSTYSNLRLYDTVGDTDDNVIRGSTLHDTISGLDGDDILYGQDGFDTLIGGLGADTFVFETASAFNDVDVVSDFNVAEGDALDLSELLSGYDATQDAIADFIQITDNGTDTTVSVDADGGADAFLQIATLTGVTGLTDENLLETSGNLITV